MDAKKVNHKMSQSEQIDSGQKHKPGHPHYAGHSTETFSFYVGDAIPVHRVLMCI